ncbi:flavodoxin family protein [Tardiphaga sp. 866_E4_N2_1]|uniref:flavodoxin family protein n=1 Tax=unclassified Tardiphaga TaxID=2631404 RepID=UPI003F25653D
MTKIAVVFFSGYGHTAKLAEAVQQGASSVLGTDISMLRIDANGELKQTALEDLVVQDGIIYGSPTYAAGPAWQFKKFADSFARLAPGQPRKHRVSAGFTSSSSANGDGLATIIYLFMLSQQYANIWVGTSLRPPSADDEAWTAGSAGAAAVCPVDALPDEAPRTADLENAFLLGKRVAEVAAKLAS